MNNVKINEAIIAANEFVYRAEKVLDEAQRCGKAYTGWMLGTPATSALRRQSMELTRALAEMRKPSQTYRIHRKTQ